MQVTVKTETIDRLGGIAARMGKSGDAVMVGARAVGNLVRQHLFALDVARPNQLGGPRTHFYSAAAKAVQEPKAQGATAAVININRIGLAQRWLGGPIKAGQGTSSFSGAPTKYLAIPARSEAYGKTPGEFHDLTFVPLKRGRGMLVQAMQTQLSYGRKKKDGTRTRKTTEAGGLAMFWLVPEVDQKPDDSVMPTVDQMQQAAASAMGDFLARQLLI